MYLHSNIPTNWFDGLLALILRYGDHPFEVLDLMNITFTDAS